MVCWPIDDEVLTNFFLGRWDCSIDCDAEESGDEGRQPGAERGTEGEGERGVDGHLRRAHRQGRSFVNIIHLEKKFLRPKISPAKTNSFVLLKKTLSVVETLKSKETYIRNDLDSWFFQEARNFCIRVSTELAKLRPRLRWWNRVGEPPWEENNNRLQILRKCPRFGFRFFTVQFQPLITGDEGSSVMTICYLDSVFNLKHFFLFGVLEKMWSWKYNFISQPRRHMLIESLEGANQDCWAFLYSS